MKSLPAILDSFLPEIGKKSKNKTARHLNLAFRTKKVIGKRYICPPKAPHNTTQEIIDFHTVKLYDEDDLMGNYPNLLYTIA